MNYVEQIRVLYFRERDLLKGLKKAGIKSVKIKPAEPTLEDVFLVLSDAGGQAITSSD